MCPIARYVAHKAHSSPSFIQQLLFSSWPGASWNNIDYTLKQTFSLFLLPLVFLLPKIFNWKQNIWSLGCWTDLWNLSWVSVPASYQIKSNSHASLNFKNLQIGQKCFEEKMLSISKRQNKMLFVLLEFFFKENFYWSSE